MGIPEAPMIARNCPGMTVPDTLSIIFFYVVSPGLQQQNLPVVMLAVISMFFHASWMRFFFYCIDSMPPPISD